MEGGRVNLILQIRLPKLASKAEAHWISPGLEISPRSRNSQTQMWHGFAHVDNRSSSFTRIFILYENIHATGV